MKSSESNLRSLRGRAFDHFLALADEPSKSAKVIPPEFDIPAAGYGSLKVAVA
jgi:hypothetical protein